MRSVPPIDHQSNTSRLRLRTLIRLRWIAVLGQTIAVLAVYWGLGFDLPLGICLAVIALSAWLNIFLRIRYLASQRLKNTYAMLLLSYDILQLTALLYLTGGLQNPFALLLIVPVAVSASTQKPVNTIFLGVLAITCTTGLAFFSEPMPWYPGTSLDLPFLFKVGVWAGVVSGMLFIGLYAWRIAKETRQMSNALAATEMVLAREQQLSALDGLAAAAAHELGTPLSTISVIAKELERELPDDSPLADDVTLLRTQAQRCRDILGTLTERDGESDIMLAHLPLSHLIEEVVQPHKAFGRDITVEIKAVDDISDMDAAQPILSRNPGVIYGLGNIIENAVDFARSKVEVIAQWSGNEVFITIIDDGPGFRSAVMEHLGEPYVTTRPATGGKDTSAMLGMGLGFFIAKTLLERSGARIALSNRHLPQSGAVVRVTWPRNLIDSSKEPAHLVAE